eukprot:9474009-Pyramimonas_sp.AAC.1
MSLWCEGKGYKSSYNIKSLRALTSFCGSSCTNNNKGALNTPDEGKGYKLLKTSGHTAIDTPLTSASTAHASAPATLLDHSPA